DGLQRFWDVHAHGGRDGFAASRRLDGHDAAPVSPEPGAECSRADSRSAGRSPHARPDGGA
ncbi:MAG: hypothetical protein ACRDNE_16165, partial [Gaiellaceae bacterium]